MSIARAVSSKFKAFSFLVIESYSVPVFRSSAIPRFLVSLSQLKKSQFSFPISRVSPRR